MDLRKFDKRIVQRNIDKGLVTPKDYQKYLSDLKNLEDEYEVFEVQPPDEKASQEDEAEEQNPDPEAEPDQAKSAVAEEA